VQLNSTMVRRGGEWSALRSGRFTIVKESPVSIAQKGVWDPESVWTFW
jgi:hypothetical protein